MNKGMLYICPTPIGNLKDITLRTLEILKQVDVIAAEDTRHTIKLLNHYNIKKPLTSYHEHNRKGKGEVLLSKLKQGQDIALVSDAGMPGISDPGEDLINLSIQNNIKVQILPGATASIIGLLLSGFSAKKFIFEGFLSSNKRERKKELEKFKYENRTVILYESPHRLINLISDIKEVLKDRKISISKELTKIHEQTFRGTAEEALKKFKKDKIKGEFVVIIEGLKESDEEEDYFNDLSIKQHIKLYIKNGLTKKQAIKQVALDRNIPKREVYKESINL